MITRSKPPAPQRRPYDYNNVARYWLVTVLVAIGGLLFAIGWIVGRLSLEWR